jgi:hypothetical protein
MFRLTWEQASWLYPYARIAWDDYPASDYFRSIAFPFTDVRILRDDGSGLIAIPAGIVLKVTCEQFPQMLFRYMPTGGPRHYGHSVVTASWVAERQG